MPRADPSIVTRAPEGSVRISTDTGAGTSVSEAESPALPSVGSTRVTASW